MIRFKIYIEKYDWLVNCYISVTHYATSEILANLRGLGCEGRNYTTAKEKLLRNALNGGLTYSSFAMRESVMVTSIASSADEQFNTICHEVAHVCAHIAKGSGIDASSEEFAYLVGDFSMYVFPRVKDLLCDCCRTKRKDYERRFN